MKKLRSLRAIHCSWEIGSMERQLKRAALLAVVAVFAVGCSAQSMSGSAATDPARVVPARVVPPRIVPAVLVPVDENGNLHGSVGPWAFFFDLDDESVRPSNAEVESTARDIATYMRANSSVDLRIDAKGPPSGIDPYTLALRNRRIDAIRHALVVAGVPNDRIKIGVGTPEQAHPSGFPAVGR